MGKVLTLVVLFVAVLVGVTLYLCPCLLKDPKVPEVPSHRWWGPGQEPPGGSKVAGDIRPFRVEVPDDELLDLKDRLRNARLSPPLEGATFQYGFNTDYLRSILDYWLNKYDWRREEFRLNQFPQFLAKIEGIDVHFVHVKPDLKDKKVKVFPLLMIHGWPGSVVEFQKVIPLLTSGVGGVAFEVVCPSIPGYGFSEAPHHPGFTSVDAARTFKKLMEALGHQQFYVQGGDWGSHIGSMMSMFHSDKVRGLHLNLGTMAFSSMPQLFKYILGHVAPSVVIEGNQKFNIFPFKEYFSNLILETGYFHIQATKPDTVGVALGDSPIGLAAYILEKFSTGTNVDYRDKKDGGLLDKFTLDDLLTNIMVYWVTNTATSSMRLYKENMKPEHRMLKLDAHPILVPTGLAIFPHEIMNVPRSILSHKYRQILTYNLMSRGGHFAAFEEPQLLADDIRAFVSACEAYLKEQKLKSQTEDSRPETKAKNKQASPTKKQAKEKTVKKTEEPVIKRETKTTTVHAEKPVNRAPVEKREEIKTKVTSPPEIKVEKLTTPTPAQKQPTTTKFEGHADKPTTQEPPKPTIPVTPQENFKKESPRSPQPEQPKQTTKPVSKEQPQVEREPAKPEIKKTHEAKTKDDSVKPNIPEKDTSGSVPTKVEDKRPSKEATTDPKTKPEAVPTPKAKEEIVVPIQKTEKAGTIGKPEEPIEEGRNKEQREKSK